MLSDALDAALAAIAPMSLPAMIATDPEPLFAALDALPASAIAWAERTIAERAGLYAKLGPVHRGVLEEAPWWAFLLIFHRNGYLREAALRRLGGPARSAFAVAAIAARLNDWARPVRFAAFACAARVFPVTPAETIAAAALDLAPRLVHWGARDPLIEVLIEAFTRPDVVAHLAALLARQRQGPSQLVAHLRTPRLDAHLLHLARSAILPGMRREALYILIEGRVRWRTGREKRWIDKSAGVFRSVPAFTMRPVERPDTVADLLALGIADRSAEVRRATLDAVMLHHPGVVPDEVALVRLAADRHRSIRERIDYLRRHGRVGEGSKMH